MDNRLYRLFKRAISLILITLHLITFGPIKEAIAFSVQSTSYKLNSGTLNEGGKDRAGSTSKLWQDALGESCGIPGDTILPGNSGDTILNSSMSDDI